MSVFTLIRPANDAVAAELSNWGLRIQAAISPVHQVAHDLFASGATRSAVTDSLTGSRCILFYGHGSDAELLGASSAVIDMTNIGRASGSIMVAIACFSSRALGPHAVRRGVSGYLGFRERLVWVSRDPDGQFEPAAVAGIGELLKGNDLGSARRAMQAGFDLAVQFYLNGDGRNSPNRALGWLAAFWDSQHVSLDGQSGATL